VYKSYANDMTPIERAIKACGSAARLAKAVGVSANAPHMWRVRGRVPSTHCAAIEKATGGQVTRRDLRPDDWAHIWPELVNRGAEAAA
jgi:DNA-binding transcriptional regulator YdaS (Cro superfamily)